MKKVNFLILGLLLIGLGKSFSQSQKDDLKLTVSTLPLIGSSGNFTSGINGFVFKPSIAYYIADNTSIEINFSYATMNNLTVGTIDSYYNSYAIVPAIRNCFINKAKIRVFAEAGFGFGTIRYSPDNSDYMNYRYDDLSGGISVLSVGFGGNYYFNDRIGIEIIVPYILTNNITSRKSNLLYSGVGPTFGLTFKLN